MAQSDINAVKSALRRDKHIAAARKLARVVTHADPDAKTKRHTTRLEKDLAAWIRYFGEFDFYLPFSDDHKEAIKTITRCLDEGEQYSLAMPRGSGKTTLMQWALLYAMLTGKRRYITYIAATGELAKAALDFVKLRLETSERLAKHYPHVTTYVTASEGKALRAHHMLRADMQTAGLRWTTDDVTLPTVTTYGQDDDKGGKITREEAQPYPSNGVIIRTAGITGAIRGKKKDHANQASARPDLVIIDDPQTRESAESESQTNTRERIITGDVMGLAGPKVTIAAVMLCTVIKQDDLSSRFLDHEKHPEWNGKITRMVTKWPEAQESLWDAEYADLWKGDKVSGTKHASAFYRRNRKAMDKGAAVSWRQRIRKGEISALHTAQNLRLELGAQFWAEYQNDPQTRISSLYTLTPHLILSRIDHDRQPGEIPDWTELIIASSDINPSYALSSAIFAFGRDQRAAVLWHNLAPMNASNSLTEGEKRAAVYAQLAQTGKVMQYLPFRPQQWYIDGAGTPENTVIGFAAHSQQICGIQAWACFGRGFKQYRPSHRNYQIRMGENLHTVIKRGWQERWIIWHADYWREIMQRGWTGSPGAPGSISLPAGNDHDDFAEQICREQLTAKIDVGGQVVWVWHTAPGAHDFGDVAAQAFMGAAHSGIGTAGAQIQRAPQRRKATIKFVG